MNDGTWVVIGSGKSILELQGKALPETSIACNRAIEVLPAGYWIWVDRMHYERSKWHAHVRDAQTVYPLQAGFSLPPGRNIPYRIARSLACGEGELFLSGGTLTVAAHFAILKGARRLVFLGCDAWEQGQDRYHLWDGAPLSAEGQRAHEGHLSTTAAGIRQLSEAYPAVELFDATPPPGHLGLRRADISPLLVERRTRGRRKAVRLQRDESVPRGYGPLVSVTALGKRAVILWFENSAGSLAGVRMDLDLGNGLSLCRKGQTFIGRE